MSSGSADNISLNPGGAIPRAASRRNRFSSRGREKIHFDGNKTLVFRATAKCLSQLTIIPAALLYLFIYFYFSFFLLAPRLSHRTSVFSFISFISFIFDSPSPRPAISTRCNLFVRNGSSSSASTNVGVDNLFLKGRFPPYVIHARSHVLASRGLRH